MLNNTKKTIAVDVDLTVVDTLTSWIYWYEDKTGQTFDWSDLHRRAPKKIMQDHMADPLSYWTETDIYDKLIPEDDCVETLKRLSMEYNIIFATKSTPGHMASKEEFLNRNFPFHSGIVHTGNKELISADYFIDDFDQYCQMISEGRPEAKILFKRTKANMHQTVANTVSVCNWRDIDVYFT